MKDGETKSNNILRQLKSYWFRRKVVTHNRYVFKVETVLTDAYTKNKVFLLLCSDCSKLIYLL